MEPGGGRSPRRNAASSAVDLFGVHVFVEVVIHLQDRAH